MMIGAAPREEQPSQTHDNGHGSHGRSPGTRDFGIGGYGNELNRCPDGLGRPPLPLDVRKERRLVFFRTSKGVLVAAKPCEELLQGTLDLLVLRALQLGPMHGWGITERLENGSRRLLQIGQGSLYPALYRLERQGFISSTWGSTENNRRARYYALTASGRTRLADERQAWRRMARAVEFVLAMEG
jgi:PadR family transcriptional regulator PadR